MGGSEGNNPHAIRFFDMIFSVVVTLCGALFFLFVARSITGVAHSTWVVPMIACIFLMSCLSVFAITVGAKKMIPPITLIAFLPSIIFMPVLLHICVVVMMSFVIMHGLYEMRHALFNLLKVDIPMIVRSGILYVSFGVVVIVTSQYYFHIKGDENFVFDARKHTMLSNTFADYVLQKSTIKDVSVNTMTVDQFLTLIIQKHETQSAVQGPQIPSENEGLIVRWAGQVTGMSEEQIKKSAQDQALVQMRANMSELLGREISGDEMISDVLADLVEMQVNQLMTKNTVLREHQMEIFAITFFIVLISIAPIIRIFVNIVTRVLFFILRELKVVRITNTQRDAEVIIL